MRLLIADVELSGLDFALRAIADGHEVTLAQPTPHPIGQGFDKLRRVQNWRDAIPWVGKEGLIVLTGNAKWLAEMDRLRDVGYKVFGPSLLSARLEIERDIGMKAMQAVGIEVPEYLTFNSLDEAEKHARKSDQAYVFKTLGSEDDKSLSYVSGSPADLAAWIGRQKARGLSLKGPCMLQEKIDMVAELGVSGWFGPEGFLPGKWQTCFEHKKLCNGEIGPNTGEMGTVCQYAETDKLYDQMLKPMEPVLKALGHSGDFAIGCGIDSKGNAWPFEFTCRLGWPAFYIQCASHKGDVAQWMMDLLNGLDTLKVDYRPAVGVVLAQPPWPEFDGKPECVEGNPVTGMDDVWGQSHPVMMMRGKGPNMEGGKVKDGPQLQTAGELVACMTGLASTVEKACKSVYAAVDQVCFSDMLYRTDIGEKVIDKLPALHRAGYCLSMEA